MTIGSIAPTGVTRLVNEAINSKASLQHVMMAIAMAQGELQQTKAGEITRSAAANVNRLDAANQLKAQANKLKGMRVDGKLEKSDELSKATGGAAAAKAFVDNLRKAGIEMSAEEYTKWSAGKMTEADLDTINSRITTMSDAASNQSTMINLELQRANNGVQQATSMFMNFLDTIKQMFGQIFR